MFRVLDLFCGCGGMSWGLQKAGMEIVAGIDIDAIALKTFRLNHPSAIGSCVDISTTSPSAWFNKIGLDIHSIDCVVGGPPCQGFSKNVPRSQRTWDDERNLLVKVFLDFIRLIRPKIVIMENVAEMINGFGRKFTDEIRSILIELGYSVDVQRLNAADYGVPQVRRRAFFFASRIFEVSVPKQTHFASNGAASMFSSEENNHIPVWDAIGDLPALENGEGFDPTEYDSNPQTKYQKMMRECAVSLRNHVARPLSKIQFERLASIGPGEGVNQLPDHLKTKSSYSGAYGRLTKEMVARTLTRWMFHPGSGRFGHPVDTRTITIREGARLQSFSDDFVFAGSFTQASSQIGNSVPPMLMRHFAAAIYQKLGVEVNGFDFV